MRKFTRESRCSISAANTAPSPATADQHSSVLFFETLPYSQLFFTGHNIRDNVYSPASSTFNFQLSTFNFQLPLVMPAQRISFHAVLRTPLVRHVPPNFP